MKKKSTAAFFAALAVLAVGILASIFLTFPTRDQDAYTITLPGKGSANIDITHEIDTANRTRVLSMAEGGKAEFVVKNLNHEALGQLELYLRRNILQMSMTPDLSDESFAGNASGVAIQYKLWGIEQVRASKERSFSSGYAALLSACSGGLAFWGKYVDLSAGQVTFYKNLPQNHTELAQTLLSLSPVLSQRTILERLPWVSDVDEELRRKAAEEADKTTVSSP